MINFFKRGLRGISGHKMMGAASVCIVASTLILLGIFMSVGININAFMKLLGDSREINVYISSDVSGQSIEDIGAELGAINGVKTVTYRSREERLKNVAKQIYGRDSEELTSGENILRDSYILVVSDTKLAEEIAKKAEQVLGVEEIVRNSDIINGIDVVCSMVKSAGILIMAMLLLISVFIIFNTIKLCVSSQSEEIRLMKMIGATDGFIRTPYIFQGVFLGLSGAVLSGIATICVYGALTAAIDGTILADIVSLASVWRIALTVIPAYCIIGIAVGIIGSAVSVEKYLGQKRG